MCYKILLILFCCWFSIVGAVYYHQYGNDATRFSNIITNRTLYMSDHCYRLNTLSIITNAIIQTSARRLVAHEVII